ncbi:ASCH domain-containing protein [bacterium]|nr:ASCH domain-containing protein [bacterium]
MKALTVSQPWASLIVSGEKFVENRTRVTHYRGTILIHAGKGRQYLDREALKGYTTGAIIGRADLIDCIRLTDLQQRPRGERLLMDRDRPTVGEILNHRYTDGPVLWILANARKLATPIPCNGNLGLWNYEPDETATCEICGEQFLRCDCVDCPNCGASGVDLGPTGSCEECEGRV